MPDEPIHLEQLDGEWRLRADLMTYLDSLFIEQLGSCWPAARAQPGGADAQPVRALADGVPLPED